MKEIIFWEENNQIEVFDLIQDIAEQGIKGDQNAQTLARYITEGLTFLRKLDLPSNKRMQQVFKEDNGDLRTLTITKPLVTRPPLLELRINRSEPGAFRAIYFEYRHDGKDYLIFTKALLKKGNPNPTAFQRKVVESYAIYRKFIKNPAKFLK